jgi:hypothetical protein
MSLIGLLNYFEQQRGREQYGNLLNEYRTPGDPNALPLGNNAAELDQSILARSGGFKGEGGVLSGGPPPEFYLRAGALPGYQNLAGQAQTGQQAMERQMQGQQWSSQNMTLAQKTDADMRQQQANWDQQRREFEWSNPSTAQQASIDNARAQTAISAGHLGLAGANQNLAQQRFNAEFMPAEGGGFQPRPVPQQARVPAGYQSMADGSMIPIPGTDDWRKGQQELAGLNEGIAGAKSLAKHLQEYGTAEMWNRDRAAVANVHRNAAITGLGVLSNMGVLQPGDYDRLSGQLADPTDIGPSALISRRGPAVAAANEVAKRLEEAASATSSRFKGQSAAPKSLNYNQKTGRLE